MKQEKKVSLKSFYPPQSPDFFNTTEFREKAKSYFNLVFLTQAEIYRGLAHNFSSPLNAAWGFAQLYDVDQNDAKEFTGKIQNNIEKLNDILTLLAKKANLFSNNNSEIFDLNNSLGALLECASVFPTFKHSIQKDVTFDDEIPTNLYLRSEFFYGIELFFWLLIQMAEIATEPVLEVTTSFREKVISVQMLFSSKKNIIAQDKNDLDGLPFDLELLPVIKAFMDSQKWDCDVFYTDTSLRLVVSKKYERAVERQ